MREPLTVGSLFSGIGGIDLGLERAGMVTRWFVEIDPHCRNVLRRHWPSLPVYGDITAIDWITVERVDVLAGGFPCQPVSNAGKRLGTDDERWLWPEFARAIRALEPRYVLVENVAALLGRGFDEVITDLAALGYDAEWDCIPAAAVGAPHLRDRLWIVAYASRVQPRREEQWTKRERTRMGSKSVTLADSERQSIRGRDGLDSQAGTGEGQGPQRQRIRPDSRSSRDDADPHGARLSITGNSATSTASSPGIFAGPALDRDSWWLTEPDVGRVAHGVPHRVDRLRALGNAVVPQVVEWIGRRIVAFDERGDLAA